MIWDRKAHKDQLPVRFRGEVHGGTGRAEASRMGGGVGGGMGWREEGQRHGGGGGEQGSKGESKAKMINAHKSYVFILQHNALGIKQKGERKTERKRKKLI